MKKQDFNYQNIKPYIKPKFKIQTIFKDPLNCYSEKCFNYYKRHTKSNINYSLEKTFQYIDKHYDKLKFVETKNDKTTASEKLKNTSYLLQRLSELEYQQKNSFSVSSCLVTSFCVSFCIAIFQIPVENGLNFFEFVNNWLLQLTEYISNSSAYAGFAAGFASLVMILLLFSIPITAAIYIANNILGAINEHKLHYKMIIVPYEKKVVLDTLTTYSHRYKYIE